MITFVPGIKSLLRCDFGNEEPPHKPPEMIKKRFIVIISKKKQNTEIALVLPFSTKEPIIDRHIAYEVNSKKYPFLKGRTWIKCGMIQPVSLSRLDRIRYNGKYGKFFLANDDFLNVMDIISEIIFPYKNLQKVD